jgi:DNA primase
VVNFDPDQAGQNATERSIQLLLEEGIKVRVLALPDGLDPDEYCGRHGGESYRALLDSAADYFIWLAERARQQFDLRTADGRVAAFQFLMPSIHLLRDKFRRVAIANELAEYLRVDRSLVLEQFRRAAAERREDSMGVQRGGEERFIPGEKMLLRCLLQSEEARGQFLEKAIPLAAEQDLACHGILEAIQSVAVQGEEFHYSAVEGRLTPADQEAMSRLVFDVDVEPSLEDAQQAFAALQRRHWEARWRAVGREIAEAEKAGDQQQALALLRQKKALEEEGREIGSLRRVATPVAAAS